VIFAVDVSTWAKLKRFALEVLMIIEAASLTFIYGERRVRLWSFAQD
jgi:hypothetical protein